MILNLCRNSLSFYMNIIYSILNILSWLYVIDDKYNFQVFLYKVEKTLTRVPRISFKGFWWILANALGVKPSRSKVPWLYFTFCWVRATLYLCRHVHLICPLIIIIFFFCRFVKCLWVLYYFCVEWNLTDALICYKQELTVWMQPPWESCITYCNWGSSWTQSHCLAVPISSLLAFLVLY